MKILAAERLTAAPNQSANVRREHDAIVDALEAAGMETEEVTDNDGKHISIQEIPTDAVNVLKGMDYKDVSGQGRKQFVRHKVGYDLYVDLRAMRRGTHLTVSERYD